MEVEIVRIKWDNQMHEFNIADLDVTPQFLTDESILRAVSQQLNGANLDGYVCDPNDADRVLSQYASQRVLDVRHIASFGV